MVAASSQRSGAASNGSGPKRRRSSAAPTDAISLLKADHRTVEKLFRDFERSSETAYKTRRKLVDKMISELSVHAAIEEQFLYPAARREVPELESDVLEAVEEHHVVKWLLTELERTDPTDERFTPKVTVLIENVRHHVHEEEQDLFPELRGPGTGTPVRARCSAGRRQAPRSDPPHPRLPDTPPGNLITGAVAGAIDMARDKVAARSR